MTLVYLDTETTGLDPSRHEVWEIAYAVDDGPVLSSIVRHSLTNAHPLALDVNGYHERYWLDATTPPERDRFEADLFRALKGATLVGANPAFDAAFLSARWGEAPWRYRLLDVEAFALPFFGSPEIMSLKDTAAALRESGFEIPEPDHSAAADVRTLRQVHRALCWEYGIDLAEREP